MDAEAKEAGETSLREDIRVHDRSPTLVIDVKGISGCPRRRRVPAGREARHDAYAGMEAS